MQVATDNQDNDKSAAMPSLSKRGASRRRLTRAGLAAGGVLATLTTKSAMAAAQCKSPSGSLSGGISSHYAASYKCDGFSPSEWKSKSSWPIPKDTKFCPTFYADTGSTCPTRMNDLYYLLTGTHYQGKSYACCTFGDLINGQTCDTNNLGAQFVAAYLNIVSLKVTVIQSADLLNMWRELQTTGKFSPTAGTYWNSQQVAQYLSDYINI